jgi:hypothetical protein
MSRSLGDLSNFVQDAYRITLKKEFVPEDIVIGTYTFLPWVRGGVGAFVNNSNGGLRASVQVSVPIQADGQGDLAAVPPPVQVRGPGDVIGLDERPVIRRYPMPGATNAEDTFLAHIEFDRPVMPWLFSPTAASGDQLVPWIALVVLEQGRYSLKQGSQGRPDHVATFLGELQPTDDAWAWAHAQLIGPVGAPTDDDRLTAAYGPVNLSRLLCPRKLDAATQYLACVVPLYNAGVATGLDLAAPANLEMAWTRAGDLSDVDTPITLPVYTSWRFATGEDGDFGSLAEKLIGVPAPWQVGRRLTDMSTPRGGLPPLADGDNGRLQTIRTAVYSPNAPEQNSMDPREVAAFTAETATWPTAETETLRNELNRPNQLAAATATQGSPVPRPIIGPEIYDRYQAALARVDPNRDDDWFGELNLQPKNRIAAGLGTRVVQKDQEQLMQAAWAQVGEVDAVNRAMRWAQLARFVGASSYVRHISPLSFGDLMAATQRVHSRVLAEPALTVAADIARSNLADSAATSAFRRVTRPLGGLARFVADDPAAHARLIADGDTARDMQRPYRELGGVDGIGPEVAAALDPGRVAPALGGDPTAIAAALDAAGQALAAQPAGMDIATEQIRTATPNTKDFAAVAGKQLLTALDRGLKGGNANQPIWKISAAAAASAVTAVPELAEVARSYTTRLLKGIDLQPPPPDHATAEMFVMAREANPQVMTETFTSIGDDLVTTDWPGTPLRPGVGVGSATLLNLLEPAANLTARMKARIGASLPSWLPIDWFDDLLLNPVMVAPVFTRPMYLALDAYSRDWLLPGLNTFPQPNIVTVLQSNPAFVEAFLGGLSHEMGRELLWRGYPTDQRGTYFRRFWNQAKDDLVQDIARFAPTDLGSHVVPTLNGVVLMVRGELIRRYPHAVVLGMLAGSVVDGVPVFDDPAQNPGKVLAPIIFHGPLPPDIVLVGFDLTVEEITTAAQGNDGSGWWFVIAEHPTAPRFGLDDHTIVPTASRDQLGWDSPGIVRLGSFLNTSDHVVVHDAPSGPPETVTFGAEAASTARVLLRDPIRAAFEAGKMLRGTGALNG